MSAETGAEVLPAKELLLAPENLLYLGISRLYCHAQW